MGKSSDQRAMDLVRVQGSWGLILEGQMRHIQVVVVVVVVVTAVGEVVNLGGQRNVQDVENQFMLRRK